METFSLIFLSALAATIILRLWLSRRQIQHVAANRDAVPEAFTGKISLAEHQKAADYTTEKTRLSMLSTLWDSALVLLWTFAGGLALFDQFWSQFDLSPLWLGTGFLISLTLIMSIIDLPFALYSTFNIEARYGFNRTTFKLWLSDLMKGGLLMLVIGTPLLMTILWLMESSGAYWWVYTWLVWTSFSLLMMWAYPAFIAPIFNKFSPLDNEELKQRINNLLERCGFHSQGVYVMDGSKRSSHGNAYFTGFGQNKRIVFFDNLLESLKPEEIEAVLAHELGHFKKHHIRKGLIVSIISSLIGLAVLAWLKNQAWFYSGLGMEQVSLHAALILFAITAPVFTFFLQPLFSQMSRKHEFEADEFASQQTDAKNLVTALVSLYRENANTLTPDPIHSAFYDSHPPASVRIAHLTGNAT
ncbi:MAG: M48 family metallopeptidase [Gammaproteobacteria bacterium]|nr:M48 family metallopeptidase [Gammaproteobacteria bacterium]